MTFHVDCLKQTCYSLFLGQMMLLNVTFLVHECHLAFVAYIPCPEKNIPDIFDCNLKKVYQVFIIFDTNISDTTGDQMTL